MEYEELDPMADEYLAWLIANKVIETEDNYYIGKASDGIWVQLGEVGYELQMLSYLEVHPTPDTW